MMNSFFLNIEVFLVNTRIPYKLCKHFVHKESGVLNCMNTRCNNDGMIVQEPWNMCLTCVNDGMFRNRGTGI